MQAREIISQERDRKAADPNYVDPPPNSGASQQKAAKTAESNKGKLCMPRILWDGGYLWKFPYNTTGVPRRRFVQIKTMGGKRKLNEHPTVFMPLTLLYLDPEKLVRGLIEGV